VWPTEGFLIRPVFHATGQSHDRNPNLQSEFVGVSPPTPLRTSAPPQLPPREAPGPVTKALKYRPGRWPPAPVQVPWGALSLSPALWGCLSALLPPFAPIRLALWPLSGRAGRTGERQGTGLLDERPLSGTSLCPGTTVPAETENAQASEVHHGSPGHHVGEGALEC
jgi:hypothetical protein